MLPIFFILIGIFIYKKRDQRRRNLVLLNNKHEIKNKLYNEQSTYNEHSVSNRHAVYDPVYEEPVNSITPYLVSQDTIASYEVPVDEDEMYEVVGHEYEYDNRGRVLENKNMKHKNIYK